MQLLRNARLVGKNIHRYKQNAKQDRGENINLINQCAASRETMQTKKKLRAYEKGGCLKESVKRKRTKPAAALLAERLNGDTAAGRYDSAR